MELYYGIQLLLLVVSNVMDVCTYNTQDAISVKQILRQHNKYRRRLKASNVLKMTWNNTLADEAAKWVGNCSNIDATYRSAKKDNLVPLIGMNAGAAKYRTVSSFLKTWYRQKANYSSRWNGCLPNSKCLAYKQMVFANVNSAGCALQSCKIASTEINFFACAYSPGVIDVQERLAEKGKPCTKCPPKAGFCQHDLCVPCSAEKPSKCDCRKRTCSSSFGTGYFDKETCSCVCKYGAGPNCDERCENKADHLYVDSLNLICEDDVVDCEQDVYKKYCALRCNQCRAMPRN
ncbi:unnamed protein product [Owenia fusiformis]|uniref:Uncharacterized protein n=1 Tax=Owenia fusiformis TaxID=6347 RepID=A0A8J1TZM8_OWEFU|nr:unnamed protein product [Owenia fusiformis]